MSRMIIREGYYDSDTGRPDTGAGMFRVITGAILALFCGVFFLGGIASADFGLVLLFVFLGMLGGAAFSYWGLAARFRWHQERVLEISDDGLTDLRSPDNALIAWSDVVSMVNTSLTPDAPKLSTTALQVTCRDGEVVRIVTDGLDHSPEMIALLATDSYRSFHGAPSVAAELAQAKVPCPDCEVPSDSIKNYRMGVFLFLFIAGSAQAKNEVCCASCMRSRIGAFLLINLITANVVWPFVILPWGLVLFAMSFLPGHSRSIVRDLSRQVMRAK